MSQQSRSNITTGVLKALGVFGGVQMVTIICSILRTKLIAVWIGAAGVGLFGIFNSAIELFGVLFHLGVRDSAVRDIASSQQPETNKIIIIVRRWVLILGVIGLVVTMVISPLLSNFTFGNYDYTYDFTESCLRTTVRTESNGYTNTYTESYHVSNNQIFTLHCNHLAVTQHLAGRCSHFLQCFNGLFCLAFLVYTQYSINDNYCQNDDNVSETFVGIEGSYTGNQCSHNQDDNHRVSHLSQESL